MASGAQLPDNHSHVWRRLYEQQSEPAIRRWDVHERDRLPVVERAPDLDAPSPGAPL